MICIRATNHKKKYFKPSLYWKYFQEHFFNNIECTYENLFADASSKYFSEVSGNLEAEIKQNSLDPVSPMPIKSVSIFFIQYLPPNVEK